MKKHEISSIFAFSFQISDQMIEEEESERLRNDWKFSAMVVDRACLICFSLFIILSTCSILLSAPHITL